MDAIGSDAYLGDNGEFAENWMDNLPDGTFEKDDTGKSKTGDLADHKDVASVVKSYMNSQKLLGTAIQPLAEEATDEQVKAYRAKTGCPETAEGYEITPPEMPEGLEFDKELMTNTTKYAHDNHIPRTVFEGLAKVVMDGQVKKFKEMVAAAVTEQDKVAEVASNKLKGKWGADYDKFLEMGRRAYDLFGGKEFVALMESTGLKDNALVVETFLEIYKQIKPDEFVAGGAAGGKAAVPGQLVYDKSNM